MIVRVTGSAGFIGQHLVRRLLHEGHTVSCPVRNDGQPEAVFGGCGNIELVTGDIAEPETPTGIAKGVDYVDPGH